MRQLLIIILIVFIISAGFGQTKNDLFMSDLKAVNALLSEGNYKESVPLLEKINSFRPNTYSVIYNLSACYAVTGRKAESLKWLHYLLSINSVPRFDADSDFVSIKSGDDYKILLSAGLEFEKFKSISTDAVTFSERTFHPESAALNTANGFWYSGSIRTGDVYEFNKEGKRTEKVFRKPSQVYSVFSVRLSVDKTRLFVTASVTPNMVKTEVEPKKQSALLIYETKTGKLLAEKTLEGDHALGDMTADNDENLYLSDSNSPVIYVFSQKNKSLTEFLTLPDAWNLQGIAFSSDFNTLFVADYIKGIFKIDMKSKKITELLNKTDISLKGIDGMRFYKNSLLVIQNGVSPIRISRLRMDNGMTAVTDIDILEQNNSDLNEPTNGIIADDAFFYLSNSPWGAYDRQFNFNEQTVKHPIIKRINLK